MTFLTDTSLLLVAVLPKPRDLEIARVLGWYRIPLKHAPKVISVDYLAFYQPGSFKTLGGQIEFIAPVRGHELTTRAELFKDQVNHARAAEEYYKIQLGSLERLPRPLPAGGWRRVTFLYTTGAYFARARSVSDLAVQSSDRVPLWQALRERAGTESTLDRDALPVELPLELLAYLGAAASSEDTS
jgi:hypothetical protein